MRPTLKKTSLILIASLLFSEQIFAEKLEIVCNNDTYNIYRYFKIDTTEKSITENGKAIFKNIFIDDMNIEFQSTYENDVYQYSLNRANGDMILYNTKATKMIPYKLKCDKKSDKNKI
jgi:hypothetical protein